MSRRRSMRVCGLVLAVTAVFLMASLWTRGSAPHLSREALRASFDADMRHVVYEWDPNDRRPASERREALFGFIYQTYKASAWIPQSLFDSNVVTQIVVGDVDTIVGEKVGLVRWRDNARVRAFGMAPNVDSSEPLRWTVNCLVCHTAEIDGVAYLGAGTKTFDDLWLGESLKRLTSTGWRSLAPRRPGDAALIADANRILNSHHHDKIDSLTRARSTAFAASHVELFMRPHNGSVPTLHHLLGPVSERPKIFQVMAARKLDRTRAGQPLYVDPSVAALSETERLRRFGADRNWFNTARPGCGNGGHDVWPLIGTDENRRALIEYLKTL